MAAPEYMNHLRKSSQLGFGVYSWLQLITLYIRIALRYVTLSENGCQLSLNRSEDGV